MRAVLRLPAPAPIYAQLYRFPDYRCHYSVRKERVREGVGDPTVEKEGEVFPKPGAGTRCRPPQGSVHARPPLCTGPSGWARPASLVQTQEGGPLPLNTPHAEGPSGSTSRTGSKRALCTVCHQDPSVGAPHPWGTRTANLKVPGAHAPPPIEEDGLASGPMGPGSREEAQRPADHGGHRQARPPAGLCPGARQDSLLVRRPEG